MSPAVGTVGTGPSYGGPDAPLPPLSVVGRLDRVRRALDADGGVAGGGGPHDRVSSSRAAATTASG